jgi:hypothetical protein
MTQTDDSLPESLRELVSVLQVEKLARQAQQLDELLFVIANETRRAVSYDLNVVWLQDALNRPQVSTVSGVSHPDIRAPYFQSLHRLLRSLVADEQAAEVRVVTAADIPDNLQDDWQAVAADNPVWCPLVSPAGDIIGGLWLTRTQDWTKGDVTRLAFLQDAYAHAVNALQQRGFHINSVLQRQKERLKQSRVRQVLLLALVGFLLFPVRQSALGPAEVVAKNPIILSPPVDGVIRQFHVEPNQPVQKGELVFSLDDQEIHNRHEVALKALEVARADYRRATLKSFEDENSKTELQLLKAVMEQKQAEVAYTADLLKRIQVTAPRDGIAVYSDPNDWVGKPVSVGEKIVTLAGEERELLIWLPVDDAINLEHGAQVRAFLNTDPTAPLSASLRRASFEAHPGPDNTLAFQLRADFTDDSTAPRIGLKATAKVYGERVIMAYYLFRKPLAALRRFAGI